MGGWDQSSREALRPQRDTTTWGGLSSFPQAWQGSPETDLGEDAESGSWSSEETKAGPFFFNFPSGGMFSA